jgi:hypothetical protein
MARRAAFRESTSPTATKASTTDIPTVDLSPGQLCRGVAQGGGVESSHVTLAEQRLRGGLHRCRGRRTVDERRDVSSQDLLGSAPERLVLHLALELGDLLARPVREDLQQRDDGRRPRR